MTTVSERVGQARTFTPGSATPTVRRGNAVADRDREAIRKITERIDSKEKAFQPLWKRMDSDYSLWRLDSFRPHPSEGIADEDVYTSNAPRTLQETLGGFVSTAHRVVRVDNDAEQDEARDVNNNTERLGIGMLTLADELITESTLPGLQEQLGWLATTRGGWAAAKALLTKPEITGETEVDITPLDPRHLVFQKGRRGLIWAAYITRRTRADIHDEYPDFTFEDTAEEEGPEENRQEKVVDYYFRRESPAYRAFIKLPPELRVGLDGQPMPVPQRWRFMNGVIVDEQWAKRSADTFATQFPIIIRAVGYNPGVANFDIARTTGTNEAIAGMEDVGDSVFASNRGVYAATSRFLTYILDLTAKNRDGTYKVFSPGGVKTLDEIGNPAEKGTEIDLDKDTEDVVLLERPQLAPDGQTGLAFFVEEEVDGGVPPQTSGLLPSAATSGRALTILNSTVGRKVQPFLTPVELVLQGCIDALFGQYETGRYEPIEVRGKLHDNSVFNRVIKPEDIEGHGKLRVHLRAVMPQDDEAKYQIANIARAPGPNGMPLNSDIFINDNIIELQDSNLEQARIFAQMARTGSHKMLLMSQLIAAQKQGHEETVALLTQDLQRLLEQEMMQDFARRAAFQQAFAQDPIQASADGMGGEESNGTGTPRSVTSGMAPQTMPLSGTLLGEGGGSSDQGGNPFLRDIGLG